MTDEELLIIADQVRKYAKPIHSKYYVGAALLAKSGNVYTGVNIEHPSLIGALGICAERVAFYKAISEGESEFERIAIIGGDFDKQNYTTPCGVCRQLMLAYQKDLTIICKEKGEIRKFELLDLLPEAFIEEFRRENGKRI